VNFATWYFQTMHKGKIKPTIVLFSEEVWFHLSGHTDSKAGDTLSSRHVSSMWCYACSWDV